jgi:hypothetical protein
VPNEFYPQPGPTDSHMIRDKFIRAKYEQRLFLCDINVNVGDETSLETLNEINDRLFRACQKDDVLTLMKFIAHDVDLNNFYPDSDGNQKSLLHVAAEAGSTACCVALILNGAEFSTTNIKRSDILSSDDKESKSESIGHILPVHNGEMVNFMSPGDLADLAGYSSLAGYLRSKYDVKRTRVPSNDDINNSDNNDNNIEKGAVNDSSEVLLTSSESLLPRIGSNSIRVEIDFTDL